MRVDRQVCMDTVDEAFAAAADPATYVPKHERERLERERREHQERTDRILARCSSAPDLIRDAFSKHSYALAYKIAKESEGVCSNSAQVRSTLTSEVRKMSPQQVTTCGSSYIAELYWQPLEIWDWLDAAKKGKLITARGVYIMGTVLQQLDGHAMVEMPTGHRVIMRLGHHPFQLGRSVYAIGKFVEVRHFTTSVGTPVDIPTFDLVYLL